MNAPQAPQHTARVRHRNYNLWPLKIKKIMAMQRKSKKKHYRPFNPFWMFWIAMTMPPEPSGAQINWLKKFLSCVKNFKKQQVKQRVEQRKNYPRVKRNNFKSGLRHSAPRHKRPGPLLRIYLIERKETRRRTPYRHNHYAPPPRRASAVMPQNNWRNPLIEVKRIKPEPPMIQCRPQPRP